MSYIKSDLIQQSLALMSVFVNTFMYGAATSWISNAIIFLTRPGHVPSATIEQCSLMAQFFEAGRLIFAIPGGMLVNKFGRKKILISVGGLNFISWMVLCFANSVLLIYAARLIMGIAVALLYVSAYPMIGEIASPKYRGTLSAVSELANMSGQLFEAVIKVIANTYLALTTSTVALASLFFPTVYWLIESPHYLANTSDLVAARRNLSIIRPGWADCKVDREFNQLVESIAHERSQQNRVNWFNFYRVKAFRKSLQCALLLNVVAVSCGGPIMSLYVAVMLPPTPYLTEYYALISFTVQFAAAIGSTFVLDRFPRRRLYLAAAQLSFAMQMVNAVAYTVYSATGSQPAKWIFIGNNFAYMLVDRGVISPCNCTVRSEIFPHSLKGIGNALCVICQAMSLIVCYQIYDWVDVAYGIAANFAIFALNSAVLAAIIWFLLPETGGKSLADVQLAIGQNIREHEKLIAQIAISS